MPGKDKSECRGELRSPAISREGGNDVGRNAAEETLRCARRPSAVPQEHRRQQPRQRHAQRDGQAQRVQRRRAGERQQPERQQRERGGKRGRQQRMGVRLARLQENGVIDANAEGEITVSKANLPSKMV